MFIRDFVFILITVFIWGTNFVAIRYGLDEMPPFYFTAVRFFLVAFPLVFVVKPPDIETWKWISLGICVALMQFSLLFLAMSMGLEAGLASLIMQAQILFTLVFSVVFFNERPRLLELFGLFIALVGFSGFLWARFSSGMAVLPILIALIGAAFWGLGNLFYKTAPNANRFSLTIYTGLVPIIPMFALSYYIEDISLVYILNVSMKAWGALFYNAVLSTIVAYSLWGIVLGRNVSMNVLPFALLIPIFGMGSAWILLGERMSSTDQILSLIVLLGLGVIVVGPKLLMKS